VELQENYGIFEDLNAEIINIAQLERNPAMLPRIKNFVHQSFPVVADPDQVTRDAFEIFGAYIIDKEGIVQTFISGNLQARPRLDMIIAELAKVEGVEAPTMASREGDGILFDSETQAVPMKDIARVRWMWSHAAIAARDEFKLAFVVDIAPGHHIYGNSESQMAPFSMEFELPDGVSLARELTYPKGLTKKDAILNIDLNMYDEVIAMPTILLEASENLAPGEYTVKATVHYQSCNDKVCHPPTSKIVEMPLRVVTDEGERDTVAGSDGW
jgi:hypothetical protein